MTEFLDQIVNLAFHLEKKASSNQQFAYHLKNPHFKGKYIYPLSELKEVYSEIYRQEIKKYQDRKTHPSTKIEVLNAKWEDCVNLSTLDPTKIFQLEELLGIDQHPQKIEIFKFDIRALKDVEMCLYDDRLSPKNQASYKKITVKSYRENKLIPPQTVEYFAESKEEKEQPLIFAYVTHLLVKGKIPIASAEIVKFNSR